MKTTIKIACLGIIAATTLPNVSAQPRARQLRNHGMNGEGGAMREEALLDKLDTHGPLGVWGKDQRPADLEKYHTATYARIRALLASGSLTEAQGTPFKKRHEEITATLGANRSEGLTDATRSEVRGELDKLNDDINAVIQAADKGDLRTPVLNTKQHRIEEKIEFGERSGRLSKSEASSLRRKLDRVQDLEKRLKGEDLTTRERERLHEEVNEVVMDLHRELVGR